MSNSSDLLCPQCKKALRSSRVATLPDTAKIRCPYCGAVNSLGDFRRLGFLGRLVGDSDGDEASDVIETEDDYAGSLPGPPPVDPSAFDLEIEVPPTMPPVKPSSRIDREKALGFIGFLAAFFDVSFRHYLTPIIIKVSWVVIVAYVIFGTILVVAGMVLEPGFSLIQSIFPPTGPPNVFDRDGGNSGGSDGGEVVGKIIGFIFGPLALLVMSALFLMWVRVSFEFVIVMFQIAKDIEKIRESSEKE